MPARAEGYNRAARSMTSTVPRARSVDGASVVRGELRAPGSKSIAQRALIAAALAHGRTQLVGLPAGEDVARARALLDAVGVEHLAPTPASATVVGRPPAWRGGWRAERVELGESGTLARLALATLAFCSQSGERIELHASGTLLGRRSDALLDALIEGGVSVERREWPVRLRAIGPPSTVVLRSPQSSQEASALALALAAYPDENELVIDGVLPSRPYFELTRAVLRHFGASCERIASEPVERWRVRGPLRAPATPLAIEPDASLAAVALVAACLSGGECVALGIGRASAQGDVRIVEHLRAFDCRALALDGALVASGFPQRGANLDLSGEPDLAPVLAIVAAAAALVAPPELARSRFTGLGTLNRKESPRLELLCKTLSAAGWSAQAGADWLAIAPPSAPLARDELRLDPRSDHRLAFAFTLLGLVRAGIVVEDPGCVAKSWPRFWRDLDALGLRTPALA